MLYLLFVAVVFVIYQLRITEITVSAIFIILLLIRDR